MKQSSLFKENAKNHSWFSGAIDALKFSDDKQGWPDIFGKKLRASMQSNSIKTLSLFSGVEV